MSAHDEERMAIDRLVADLRPVGRLPALALRLGVWIAIMATLLLAAALVPRPDLADRLRAGAFVLETAALALAVLVLGAFALRSAEPDRVPSRRETGLALALTTSAIAIALTEPPPAGVPLAVVLARAGGCLWSSLAFGVGPALALFVAVRRGAPVGPRAAGAYAAGAGLVLAYLAMRLHCPLDDALHLALGHLLPVAAGTIAGALLGGAWLGRWHHRLR